MPYVSLHVFHSSIRGTCALWPDSSTANYVNLWPVTAGGVQVEHIGLFEEAAQAECAAASLSGAVLASAGGAPLIAERGTPDVLTAILPLASQTSKYLPCSHVYVPSGRPKPDQACLAASCHWRSFQSN